MSLDTMLAQAASADEMAILPGWGQGRATFGGTLAAIMFRHAQARLTQGDDIAAPGLELPVRSLTISFVGPVAPGAVTLSSTILRRGKSVVQMEARMLQNGAVVAAMLTSFGAGRDSTIAVPALNPPAIAQPEHGQAMPYIEGVVPEFTRHFDFRFVHGGVPFTGQSTSDIDGWMRFRELDQACDVAYLLALVDAWPPAILQMVKGFAPASTLCWTIEFPNRALLEGRAGRTGDWWQYATHTEAAGDGYGHIAAHCWNSRGELVAISRQTVTVFA